MIGNDPLCLAHKRYFRRKNSAKKNKEVKLLSAALYLNFVLQSCADKQAPFNPSLCGTSLFQPPDSMLEKPQPPLV